MAGKKIGPPGHLFSTQKIFVFTRRIWVQQRIPIALLFSVAIFMASSQPIQIRPGITGLDKVIHFLVYGLLALSYGNVSTSGGQRKTIGRLFTAWGMALLFGLSDEWHQSFVPGRTSEWQDLLADGLGAAMAIGWFGFFLDGKTSHPVSPKQ